MYLEVGRRLISPANTLGTIEKFHFEIESFWQTLAQSPELDHTDCELFPLFCFRLSLSALVQTRHWFITKGLAVTNINKQLSFLVLWKIDYSSTNVSINIPLMMLRQCSFSSVRKVALSLTLSLSLSVFFSFNRFSNYEARFTNTIKINVLSYDAT